MVSMEISIGLKSAFIYKLQSICNYWFNFHMDPIPGSREELHLSFYSAHSRKGSFLQTSGKAGH